MTLMIITDATKDPISFRLPKWIRFPLLILLVFSVLGSLTVYRYIADLEAQIVEGRLETQTAIIQKETKEREIVQLNPVFRS